MTEDKCYHWHTRTRDTRGVTDHPFIRRRRRLECLHCGEKFSTVEITVAHLDEVEDRFLDQWVTRAIMEARRARTSGSK